MTVTNPEKQVTVAKVEGELADLETTYKARRKVLRALLAVLKDEASEPKE
jgi:hypothetical protein